MGEAELRHSGEGRDPLITAAHHIAVELELTAEGREFRKIRMAGIAGHAGLASEARDRRGWMRRNRERQHAEKGQQTKRPEKRPGNPRHYKPPGNFILKKAYLERRRSGWVPTAMS